MNLRSAVCLFLALGLTPWSASAQSLPILEKARAYLGDEAALRAIVAVRFEGGLRSVEIGPDGQTQTIAAQVEITCQEPFQQLIVARGNDKTEVTALDDYEAWHRVEAPDLPGGGRVSLLGKEQVKRLRANTWENLTFFRANEAHGGEVRDGGVVVLEGRPAHQVAFVHGEGIVFTRYFDPETGRLLLTVTEQGAHIREEGELRVAGVRFPAKITTELPLAHGGIRRVTIDVAQVRVNEPLSADSFRVPVWGARLAK